MSQNPDSEEARSFLDSLWRGKPLSAAVQIWEKATGLNSTFSSLPAAAAFATDAAARDDVYMAAGLALRQTRPARTRSKANQIVGIPGVWADIDVNGGPELKTGAAPSLEVARELACELLEPTLLVSSGYGLQAWWLFEEPWIFDAAGQQREQARTLSKAFALALKARAKERGFGLDSTHDLARLMRLPGTRNHKGADPVPVALLDHEGPTYEPETLTTAAKEFMKEAATFGQELTGGAIDVHVNGHKPNPPMDRIIEIFGIDPTFQAIWTRTAKPNGDGTHSSYDLSIATRMVDYGCTDQEIAEAIRYQRAKYDPDSGKADRVDYLKLTIARARRGKKVEQQRAEAEADRAEAMEQIGIIAEQAADGEVEPPMIIALFQRVYGGPQIKQLLQVGTDHESCRLKLMLADGRDVQLGPMRGLLRQEEFTERFAEVTQYAPAKEIKATKDQPIGWRQLSAALLKAAEVIEETEDSRLPRLRAWLREYMERHGGHTNQKNYACITQDPFVEDAELYVSSPNFCDWLRRAKGLRIDKPDVNQMFRDAGFAPKRVNYYPDEDDHTKRPKRDYWHAPIEVLDDDDPKEATP